MVLVVRLVMEEVKAPVAEAEPSVVQVSLVVGSALVDQQTPCWVGLGLPRLVMLPLPVALVVAMLLTAWVVTVGADVEAVVAEIGEL